MKCAGFLLLEVALVLALILIVVTLATPQFIFLKRQIARTEVQKLIAECFYLRNCAMATHQDLTLTFDCAQGCYATKYKNQKLTQGLHFGFLPTLHGPPSNPTRLIEKAITFVNNTITFYADGTISSGTIYFLDAENSRCSALTIPSGQVPFIRHYEYQDRWTLVS